MEPEKNKNYYIEPVEIEVYLKKAGMVKTLIKDLYIELVEPEPINDRSRKIFDYFIERGEPVDIMEVQNSFPEYIKVIYDSYYQNMNLFEKLSIHFKSALSGIDSSWRQALYFTELLLKYEPTIASTKYIGDFQTYNLNYCIKKLNALGDPFLLEDSTVYFLIKRKRMAYRDAATDREFEKLVELWEYNIREKIL